MKNLKQNDNPICKLLIKNPDYKITGQALKFNPIDIEDFKDHIDELLKNKFIRHSDSPHRSPAFLVRNHSEIVRGKSRMVINYKRLNDNTEDDSYNIPDKDVLINKIQGCRVFSKFDLKSGFYQIKMAEASIPWTTFVCPQGLFEWLVMPMGLKIIVLLLNTIFSFIVKIFYPPSTII